MISIIAPVYNEEENLTEFNQRIVSVLKSMDKKYEVIYVDDGSKDKSLGIIKEFKDKFDFVHYISLQRNFGQHAAIMAGLKLAEGDIIITIDTDLQNPPEEIPKLIEEINKGFDVISTKRIDRKDNILRKLPSNLMNKIISQLTGVKLNDYGCMMRAYTKKIVNLLLEYGEKSVYIPAFTSWLTNNIKEIEIKHEPRVKGKTKYSFLKLLNQAFDLITAYTLFPIQVISIIGLLLFIGGIFLFCYLMYFRIFIGSPSSLTSFVAILIFLSGTILLSLGIISEYLVRMYKEVKKTPFYIIKESSKK